MANMSAEERERIMARMREGGPSTPLTAGGRFGGANANATGERGARQRQSAPETQSRTLTSGATTIDSLFGPLPTAESRGMAWLWMNKQLKPVRLRLGVSDGTYTEVLNEEELQPGMEVVLNVTTGLEPQARPGQGGTNNPLMGPQRGGPSRGPGGSSGGRGR